MRVHWHESNLGITDSGGKCKRNTRAFALMLLDASLLQHMCLSLSCPLGITTQEILWVV